MTVTLRVVLVLGSLLTTVFAIRRIRSARIDISDTVFWILFAFFLLLISIFPQIIGLLAQLVGVQSEENVVFLLTIAVLIYKCFTLTIKVSTLELKLKTLAAAASVRERLHSEENRGEDHEH